MRGTRRSRWRPLRHLRGLRDRSARTGRKISLNLIVIPALGATRQPDPVFWLEGGPGGAATQAVGPVSQQYLKGLRSDRDLVFVDQRGTGKSNPLKCDDVGENPSNLDAYFGKLFPLPLIRACRDKLKDVADLTLYTTPLAMDDLDDVRSALGYERIQSRCGIVWNGRRGAVHTAAPGSRPLCIPCGRGDAWISAAAALRARRTERVRPALQGCSADAACHTAFPNLKDEFDAVLARFDHGPLKVKLVDPASQQPRAVTLNAKITWSTCVSP